MLLIENTEPCVRTVESIMLIPGINRVDPDTWESLQPLYGKPLDILFEQGVLVLHEVEKLTVQIVKKTYDMKLLGSWAAELPRGPVRAAAISQLEMMEKTGRKKEEVSNGAG